MAFKIEPGPMQLVCMKRCPEGLCYICGVSTAEGVCLDGHCTMRPRPKNDAYIARTE